MDIEIGRTLQVDGLIGFGILRNAVYRQQLENQEEQVEESRDQEDPARPQYFPVEHRLDIQA